MEIIVEAKEESRKKILANITDTELISYLQKID